MGREFGLCVDHNDGACGGDVVVLSSEGKGVVWWEGGVGSFILSSDFLRLLDFVTTCVFDSGALRWNAEDWNAEVMTNCESH